MAKDNMFKEEVEKLVRYIQDNMKDKDDWVVVKYRDVPKITGISTYYVRKMFELLKDHPNIVFEIDKEAKTNKKPLKFRYTSEQEKIESVVTEKSFYYLSQDEIDYIQNELNTQCYQKLFKVLNLCNYIASLGAKEKPVLLDPKDIADIMVESTDYIESTIEELRNHNLIIDIEGYSRLILNKDSLHSVEETAQQINSPRRHNNVHHINKEQLINKFLNNQDVPKGNSEFDDDLKESNTLLSNMRNFRDTFAKMQDEFKSYLDEELEKVAQSEKKDQEMSEGFETLQKLIDENKELKEKYDSLKAENYKLVESLNKSQKYRDRFIENAEQRLEILLAEVIGIVSSYGQIPTWQKDNAANAKLQKNILNAVTAAVDDMLNLNAD
ncbi:hypothetical protein [Bacillus atrophaeus]|uniref:hypothetical protein n=1 Tax=Bacillus atrophaeus TaxID=1452 RepID=UPI002E1B11F9|nr:hypothetical protein [Bacillus atrophaeus]